MTLFPFRIQLLPTHCHLLFILTTSDELKLTLEYCRKYVSEHQGALTKG